MSSMVNVVNRWLLTLRAAARIRWILRRIHSNVELLVYLSLRTCTDRLLE
jgi:hypothetical protein